MKNIFKFLTEENSEQVAIDHLLSLSDDELKNFNEAIKLFRQGDKAKADYYEKAWAKLRRPDYIDDIQANLAEVANV